MNLLDSLSNYNGASFLHYDKATREAIFQATDAQLEEIALLSPSAAKLIADGKCKTVDELLSRSAHESVLLGAVRGYIKHKTGVVLPEELPDTPLLMPIAEKLIAEGKCTAFQQLLSRLAVTVLASRSPSAPVPESDPLLR